MNKRNIDRMDHRRSSESAISTTSNGGEND